MATLNSPTLGKHQVSLTGLGNGGGGEVEVTSEDITDSTTVGRAVLTATDAAAARTAIGAGTSSLVLGLGGTQAAAGDHVHDASTVSTVAIGTLAATDVQAALEEIVLRLIDLENA